MTAAAFLSREEERALAVRWRDHKDEAAMQAIVEAHAPLVKVVARKYARFGVAMEDLLQEGTIGLLTAAEKFEPERELRFSTYARWWVQAQLSIMVMKQSSVVNHTSSNKGRDSFFRGKRHFDVSMDAPIHEDGATYLENMESEDPRPDEATERSVDGERLTARLESALSTLNTREQMIIRARWLAEDGATLDTLGNRLGISKERVRQLETRAMQGLRKAMGVPA